MSLFIFNHF